jgi:hypothetical protein
MSRRILLGWLIVIIGGAAAATGSGATKSGAPAGGGLFGSPTGSTAAPAPAPAVTEEQRRASEISAQFASGQLTEAQAAAEAFLRSGIKDTQALLEVGQVLGHCQRKKGDWAKAASTFLVARGRCEKDSDDYVRMDGIASVLRASPSGVYGTPGTPPAAGAKTLADDAALAEALARLGGVKATKIKGKIALIKRAATPQQVLAVYTPLAVEAREMFILGPDLPPDVTHDAAVAAGTRLQELGTAATTQLQAKLEGLRPKFRAPWGMNNLEKDDVANTSRICSELADVEKAYQQTLPLVAGKAAWPEQELLQSSSDERAQTFTKLAAQFVVPKYTYY